VSATPIVHARVQPGDDPAGRAFAEAWDKRVDQSGAGRKKQASGKPKREGHMLKECFIDTGRMGEKNAL
jgi:hypothetical protein